MQSRLLLKPILPVWREAEVMLMKRPTLKSNISNTNMTRHIGDTANLVLPMISALATTFFVHYVLRTTVQQVNEESLYRTGKHIDLKECPHSCMSEYENTGIWP